MARTRTSTTGSRAGFTLLELVIALTLGAVLATAAYQAMGTAIASRDRAERALMPIAQARYLFASLDKDLRRFDPRGKKDDLACAANRCRFPVQDADGGRAVVSYRYQNGEMVREVLPAEDQVPAVAAGQAAPGSTTVAARGLASAAFAAVPAGLGADAPFPKLVSLKLAFQDKHGDAERFSHAVFLEITPDADQADAR